MLTQEELDFIQSENNNKIAPAIKAELGGLFGWVLKKVFPKLNEKIRALIVDIATAIIEARLGKRKLKQSDEHVPDNKIL